MAVTVRDTGSGHPQRASAAHLRAVLPGRPGALAGGGRHRPGARDREAPGRGPRRPGHRRERAGPGHHGHLLVPGREPRMARTPDRDAERPRRDSSPRHLVHDDARDDLHQLIDGMNALGPRPGSWRCAAARRPSLARPGSRLVTHAGGATVTVAVCLALLAIPGHPPPRPRRPAGQSVSHLVGAGAQAYRGAAPARATPCPTALAA